MITSSGLHVPSGERIWTPGPRDTRIYDPSKCPPLPDVGRMPAVIPQRMVPAFDAVSGAYTTGSVPGTSKSGNHTIGSGANRLLLIACFLDTAASDVSAVTYNGVAATSAGAIQANPNGGRRVRVYYLKDADLPATGAYSMAVTVDTSQQFNIAGISYADVDQTTPISGWTGQGHDAFGAGSQNPSVVIASATGDLVVDFAMGFVTITYTCGQTQRLNSTPYDYTSLISEKAGGASIQMDWTASGETSWVDAGLSLKAAAAGGGGILRQMMEHA